MIAVIFEVEPETGRESEYLEMAAAMRPVVVERCRLRSLRPLAIDRPVGA